MDYRYGVRYKENDVNENEKDMEMDDSKGVAKRGAPHTRGTAISFGFRRRSRGDHGNHVSIENNEHDTMPQRSKSVGPEQVRRRVIDDDDHRHNSHQRVQSASSGRSTPRLAPPKKEAVSGIAVRTNRFGFRQPQAKYTDKVADVSSSHTAGHFNQDAAQQEYSHISRATPPNSKLRPSPVNNQPAYAHGSNTVTEINRRITSGIPEPISKYTLHTSHLPLPQYAVRMNDSNSKIAKTAVNQSRKVSNASKGSAGSQSGSGTEDSGIGSHPGYPIDNETMRSMDYMDGVSSGRRIIGRPRNLRMVVSGKSFDVCDVDDDNTVTEISVIALPKSFASVNLNSGLVRERATQYQRIMNKDNRYTESTTSMSTTSSEGYDEGLGEEKVYKDRSRTEKIPSIKSDFSPPSSDDPEYGHGEAMADEYSISSSDEYRTNHTQHLKTISNAAKSGTLPKSTLRSVLLTIEDPAFAAAAATSTTFIDDETSPVDSLVDSLTASITQSDGQQSKKEIILEKMENVIDDDGPGTPTNASNSLSLSEGREYFDDEIADQPGLIFDDTIQSGHETYSRRENQAITENSQTLMDPISKPHLSHGKHVENSPMNCRRMSRTGSVDTLSPCESITSDDLMLDYERSETSSYDETNRRLESSPALHEIDDVTILSELEAQGEEVMREWSSLLGTNPHSNSNLANININPSSNNNNNNNNNNNQQTTDSGISSARTSRLLRSRTGTDSPRSLDGARTRQIASPFRPVLIGNGQTASVDSGDKGSPRLERSNYHQDIVYIKTGLLKLMRVIQEAETLNPFNNSIMNGLYHNLNEDGTTDTSVPLTNGALNVVDELTDLRRQIIYLEGQLEDKDRSIQQLQSQVAKQQELINSVDSQSCTSSMYGSNISSMKDVSNAATQTEKIRPVSAGPSLLQGFPQDSSMGPLVSWNESWNHQNSPSQRPSSSIVESNSITNMKNNRRMSELLHRPIIKSRQEQVNSRFNGDITEKSMDNLTVQRVAVSKSSSKTDIPKSSIPSLKKVTTLSYIPRVTKASTES